MARQLCTARLGRCQLLGEEGPGCVFAPQGLKSKDAKFACKDRAALLSALCFNISIATARGLSGLGTTVLG